MNKVALLQEDDVVALVRKGVLVALEELNVYKLQQAYQKQILTPAEVAELLDVSESYLAKDRCAKIGIPFFKKGGKIWYDYNDILAFMEKNRVRVH